MCIYASLLKSLLIFLATAQKILMSLSLFSLVNYLKTTHSREPFFHFPGSPHFRDGWQ
jgi:hypothetical protein